MIAAELSKLAPSARVTLYVIDASMLGGTVLRFHNGTNALSQALVWQGLTYTPFGIEAEGFEAKADGPLPRPVVRVSNYLGLIGALVRDYRQLQGAKFIRRRTRARFLDAVNFTGGVNPTADPTAEYPDDIWTFDRVARRDGEVVEWELASPIDLEGVMLPRRQIQANVCTWRYRGSECGYAGAPVAKADDTLTSNPLLDVCGRRTQSCKLRFGLNGELPISTFPGAGVLRNV